jgi:hypothetical protein
VDNVTSKETGANSWAVLHDAAVPATRECWIVLLNRADRVNAIDLNKCALLGVDVGFAADRPTTGMAWVVNGKIEAVRTHSDWPRRQSELPGNQLFDLIAIDGPLIPDGADPEVDRQCEHRFLRRPFHNRCKPGLSHFGTGRRLRQAAMETAEQVRPLISTNGVARFAGPEVFMSVPIVEAFPNAFLGVMLSDECFIERPRPRKRFDWLYDRAVAEGVFPRLLGHLGWDCPPLLDRLKAERDHERRAALICVLTAATAAVGEATPIGDHVGGYLWMPPLALLSDWTNPTADTPCP